MPGLDVSEAEVIRRIFRMAAEERRSCRDIADCLNALGRAVLQERAASRVLTSADREMASRASAQSVDQHGLQRTACLRQAQPQPEAFPNCTERAGHRELGRVATGTSYFAA